MCGPKILCCGGREGVAGPCFVLFQGDAVPQNSEAGIPRSYNCHMESAAEKGDSHMSHYVPYLGGSILGVNVKTSDPGRNSEWGRFRNKTNLSLAQGPPTVTNPRLGVRQTTGNRRKGRGRAGPWRPSLRQPWCRVGSRLRLTALPGPGDRGCGARRASHPSASRR